MSDTGGLKDFIPTIFLAVVVCIAVTLLVLTNEVTWEKIKENDEKEMKKALKEIFPEMVDFEKNETLGNIFVITGDNNTEIGIAFKAVGKGYGGKINIMVGLDNTRDQIRKMSWTDINNSVSIKRIKILEPISETPGLGAKIIEEDFQEKFDGKEIDNILLNKDGGTEGIDGITGASISSKAVINAIKDTAIEKIKDIKNKMEVV